MAKSLNKVILIGWLGDDPKMKYTSKNHAMATFSIATDLSWKDENGKMHEITDWHRIVSWNKMAEFCNIYLKKGNKVYIEGRLQTRSYEDKEGKKIYSTEVILNDLIMLNNKENTSKTSVSQEDTDFNYSLDDEKGDIPFG